MKSTASTTLGASKIIRSNWKERKTFDSNEWNPETTNQVRSSSSVENKGKNVKNVVSSERPVTGKTAIVVTFLLSLLCDLSKNVTARQRRIEKNQLTLGHVPALGQLNNMCEPMDTSCTVFRFQGEEEPDQKFHV